MYGQNAIVNNEFFGKSWSHVMFPRTMPPYSIARFLFHNRLTNRDFVEQIPEGSSESLGVQVLKARGFFAHKYWYWIGVAALSGFVVLFNLAFSAALAYLNRKY